MKMKTVLFLLAAALVAGAVAILINRHSASTTPAGLEEWNAPLLQNVSLAGLAAVAVSDSSRTVSLTLSNGVWRVRERFGYPADTARLRTLMDSLRKATLVEAVEIDPAHLGDLGLAQGQGTRLSLSGGDGRVLFALTAGSVHQKKSPDPSMAMFGGFPDGRYILKDKTPCLVSDTLDGLDEDVPQWLSKEFLRINKEELRALTIEGPGRETIRLTWPPAATNWSFEGLPAGKLLDSSRVSRLTDALPYLSFEDVADPAVADTISGLSTGVQVSAVSTNGVTYGIRIGHPAQGRRYARVSVTGPSPLPADAASQAAQFGPWIYLVSESQIEPFLFTRDQWIADPPKPAESVQAATTNTTVSSSTP